MGEADFDRRFREARARVDREAALAMVNAERQIRVYARQIRERMHRNRAVADAVQRMHMAVAAGETLD